MQIGQTGKAMDPQQQSEGTAFRIRQAGQTLPAGDAWQPAPVTASQLQPTQTTKMVEDDSGLVIHHHIGLPANQ